MSGLSLFKEHGRLWIQAEISTWIGPKCDCEYWRKYYFECEVGWGEDDQPDSHYGDAPDAGESMSVPAHMAVRDFVKLCPAEQDKHRLVQPGPLDFDEFFGLVDPYFPGFWLGDSSPSHSAFAKHHETEIIDFLDQRPPLLTWHPLCDPSLHCRTTPR
jgi:hypothetical protein